MLNGACGACADTIHEIRLFKHSVSPTEKNKIPHFLIQDDQPSWGIRVKISLSYVSNESF